MIPSIWDGIGIVGVGCVLIPYLLVQIGRISATSVRYQLINMAGCVLIGISLVATFNLPSAIIQAFWFIFSLVGLARNLRRRGRSDGNGKNS